MAGGASQLTSLNGRKFHSGQYLYPLPQEAVDKLTANPVIQIRITANGSQMQFAKIGDHALDLQKGIKLILALPLSSRLRTKTPWKPFLRHQEPEFLVVERFVKKDSAVYLEIKIPRWKIEKGQRLNIYTAEDAKISLYATEVRIPPAKDDNGNCFALFPVTKEILMELSTKFYTKITLQTTEDKIKDLGDNPSKASLRDNATLALNTFYLNKTPPKKVKA